MEHIIDQFGILFEKYQEAVADSAQVKDRIRGHLTYRLGEAALNCFKTPFGFIKLPWSLLVARNAYKAAIYNEGLKRDQLFETPLSNSPRFVTAPVNTEISYVVARADGEDTELWVTALLSRDLAPITIEIGCCDIEGHASGAIRTLELHSGQASKVMKCPTRTHLSYRKISGTDALLRFELRLTGDSSKHATVQPAILQRDKSRFVKAYNLLNRGRIEEALLISAPKYRDETESSYWLLRANLAVDDQVWLECVNSYLALFGITRLEMQGGSSPRFTRLTQPGVPRVCRGGPLVTVIMPAYNAEATIEHAANSILRQTWHDLELIIIDDCSKDGTWSAIRSIAARDTRVKTLRNSVNVGPYVSKNLGLRISSGEFITGQDADDWAVPERIERQMDTSNYWLSRLGRNAMRVVTVHGVALTTA